MILAIPLAAMQAAEGKERRKSMQELKNQKEFIEGDGWIAEKYVPGEDTLEYQGKGKSIEERVIILERHVDILHELTCIAVSTPQIRKIIEQFDLCPHCSTIIDRGNSYCSGCGKAIKKAAIGE